MADRFYLSSRYSPQHVAWIMAKLADAGFVPRGVCVWDSVGSFAATLQRGDRVVVHSLGVFDGSVEFFGALRLFFEVGATVHSLREAELSGQFTRSLIDALYTSSVDGLLGHAAELYQAVDPSTVERLARMERWIGTGVSILEASRRSGCTRNTYYYYKRLQAIEPIEPPLAVRSKVQPRSYPIQIQLPL